jgi:hypothetical protein
MSINQGGERAESRPCPYQKKLLLEVEMGVASYAALFSRNDVQRFTAVKFSLSCPAFWSPFHPTVPLTSAFGRSVHSRTSMSILVHKTTTE